MPEVLTNDPRRTARMMALQAGFAGDLRGSFEESALEWLAQENPLRQKDKADIMAFSQTLLCGVQEKRQALDELIQVYAPAWPVQHLSPVDRNILRIALFELLHYTNTPSKTAINEAVELAKVFGSESTARFVNGVLGSVMAALSRGELNPDTPVSEGR
jgi:N utilization substance protein B